MPDANLERRVEELEFAVRELRQAISTKHDWLSKVIGSMQDEPAFYEVIAYGRAIRESERPPEIKES
jgi:hypothetical protein